MAKRQGLAGVHTQIAAAVAKSQGIEAGGGTMTTAINLPRQTWELLKRVATQRAIETRKRASVSALIAELAERHRAELEAEIEGKS